MAGGRITYHFVYVYKIDIYLDLVHEKAKYSEKIRTVRKISRVIILDILKEKPRAIKEIFVIIRSKNKELCDDKVICMCGRTFGYNWPEWKHQIQWAIQDLKYAEKIQYDKENKIYSV